MTQSDLFRNLNGMTLENDYEIWIKKLDNLLLIVLIKEYIAEQFYLAGIYWAYLMLRSISSSLEITGIVIGACRVGKGWLAKSGLVE